MSLSTVAVSGIQGTENDVRTDFQQGKTVQVSAESLAESAGEKQAIREQAARELDTMTQFVRDAESSLAAGYFEAAPHAVEYIRLRVQVGGVEERAAAIKTIDGRLNETSSIAIDANQLLSAYHAWRLLDGQGEPKLTYTHFRHAFSQLVIRADDGMSYTLLPGHEEACKAAYKHAVDNKLSVKAAGERCKAVSLAFLETEAKRRRMEEERLKEERSKAAREKAEADKAAKEAATVAKAAQEAVQGATDEKTKAEAEKAVQASKEAKLKADKAAAEAKAKADAKAKEADAARSAANRTEKRLEKATAPKKDRTPLKGNIQGERADADPVRVAACLHDFLKGNGDAERVFELFLEKVKRDEDLSNRIRNAATVALSRFNAKAAEPSGNGRLAAVA